MNKLMDMHVHTSFSDGEYSPDEVITMAKNNGVGVLAITDHDNIDGIKALNNNYNNDINVVNGIEVSCASDKGNLHILGYDFDIDNFEFNEWLNDIRSNKINWFISVMEQIKRDYGIIFNYQDIFTLISKKNVGRPDLARLCIKYGFCDSVSEAFEFYLNSAKDKVKGINKRVSYMECFKLIKNSGGLVILAHPKTLLLNDDELDKLVFNMKECGLDGIEVYHSSFNKKESDYYKFLANKYNLLISGGTDYHGPLVKPGIEIGKGYGNLKIKSLSLVDEINNRHYLK